MPIISTSVPATQWCNWSIKLSTGLSKLEHFLTSPMDISSAYSLFLTTSVPQKEKDIFITFHSTTVFVAISATLQIKLEKGDLQVEKIEALVPPYAVLKY